ncbi:MAG: hypothetical protein DRI36_01320 [Caldiserica bacterium]|nr:MAG: hypothetical protein DRI36_01320 [Caldisericota bacterium]
MIYFLFVLGLFSFFDFNSPSPRIYSLGGFQLNLYEDVSDSLLNPANGIRYPFKKFSIFYTKPYNTDIYISIFSLRYPLKDTVYDFNLKLNAVSSVYNEIELNTSVSKFIGWGLNGGIGVSLYGVILDYEGDSSFTGNKLLLGIHLGITKRIKRFDLSIALQNLNQPEVKFSKNSSEYSKIRSKVLVGIGARILPFVWSGFTIFKEKDDFSSSFGIEAGIGEVVKFRIGMNEDEFRWGVGFSFNKFKIDFGFGSNEFLGFNWMANISYGL